MLDHVCSLQTAAGDNFSAVFARIFRFFFSFVEEIPDDAALLADVAGHDSNVNGGLF
jgi:hypothetical protein